LKSSFMANAENWAPGVEITIHFCILVQAFPYEFGGFF
jgi:hypothetical protein